MNEIEKAERYDCIKEICERIAQEEGVDLNSERWGDLTENDFN